MQPEGKLVLGIIDRLTHMAQLYPVRSKKWACVYKCLVNHWMMVFGKPEQICVDNAYRTKEVIQWAEKFEVELRFCSSRAHFQNGQIERFNRYLGEQIRVLKNQDEVGLLKNSWPYYLPIIALRYNSNVVDGMKFTPYQIAFGMRAGEIVALDAREYTFKRDEKVLKLLDEGAKEFKRREYEKRMAKVKLSGCEQEKLLPGLLVWWRHGDIKRSKFDYVQGPFLIVERIGSNAYMCQNVETGRVSQLAGQQLYPCAYDNVAE